MKIIVAAAVLAAGVSGAAVAYAQPADQAVKPGSCYTEQWQEIPCPAVAEDDPGFDCRTMGDLVCGPTNSQGVDAGLYRAGELVAYADSAVVERFVPDAPRRQQMIQRGDRSFEAMLSEAREIARGWDAQMQVGMARMGMEALR